MKVLVTGGSRGLGKSIVKMFVERGHEVFFTYYKTNINIEGAKGMYCDISKESDVENLFQNIEELDVIINNAGISIDNALEDKTALEFRQVLDTNLVGVFNVLKYGSKKIKKGSIINISSTNGIDTGYVLSMDYDASKAGVISLTHNMAKYLAPDIRVNCVAPGWINTDMNKYLFPDFKREEENKILLKRFATCEEVAEVVYFLASDKASYINDTVIRVDGGYNGIGR